MHFNGIPRAIASKGRGRGEASARAATRGLAHVSADVAQPEGLCRTPKAGSGDLGTSPLLLLRNRLFLVTVLLVALAACAPGPHPGLLGASTPTPLLPVVQTVVAPQTVVATSVPSATPAPDPTAGATAQSPTSVPGTANTKPNIVFVLTDDLDAAEIQYMPNLKSLITDQGITFSNYFVSMSLCCPSRSTTLRGQYPHNTQILGNQPPTGGFQKFYQLGEEKSTIAVWLQAAGYRTMLAGKYLNGYPEQNNVKYIPPGWNEWYVAVHGDAYSEFNYTLNENGKQVVYRNKPEDYGTDVYVNKAVDFIQRSAQDGKPFFVYLAPYAPHAPYTPAPRHANLFPDLIAPRTPNYDEADVSDKPAFIHDRPLLTQRQMDMIDQVYRKRLQSLQAVDEGIEMIVNTLKANGQLDNTYIFFTSDNGYHLGNHRQVVGKIAPYEEELRVTMIVRGPGVPAGRTLEHLTGNVDLAPTWADLAGAQAADFVDGRSLVPLMRDSPPPPSQWRQAFALENGPDRITETGVTATPTPDTEQQLLEPQDQDEKDTASLPPARQSIRSVPPFRGIRLQTWSYVEYSYGRGGTIRSRNRSI